jgi:hypothetical protein
MNEFLIKLTLKALCKLTRAYYKKHDVAENHDDSETIQYYGSASIGYITDFTETKRIPMAKLTIRTGFGNYEDISAYRMH